MKRFKYIHILAALFLLLGMGVQSYVSYSRALFSLQEKMDLETQIAQEKLQFELYDALDASSQIADKVKKCLEHPDELYDKTSELLNRYPNFYSCYVTFPPYYYPEEGKWFGLTSYRTKDSIISRPFGNAEHDYFEREWYKGAVQSTEGYWSTPYRDDDFDEPIYTYSKVMRDEEGKLICVIGIDFSLNWIHNLLEHFKPFEEAVFMLYGSNGTLLAMSNGAPADGFGNSWIITSKTLQPINIKMVTAVPKRHIIQSLSLGTLLPFGVFVLGIFVVGLLIRRMTRDERDNARLETEKEVMTHELEIAHDIQMSILKDENEKKKAQANGDIELNTLLVPMREVGGDFYDFHREGDELWFIIGDVSGKGVPAAIFMSAAVNLFRAAGVRAASPKEIMEEMNAILSENNPSLTFVTAFIGRLHIPTGELLFCNAGHCAPLIKHKLSAVNQHSAVRSQPSEVKCLQMESNIPLGYDGRYCFVEQGCMLGEGDTLVLYTDGVTEARNSEREMLGLKRWSDIVAKNEDLPNAIKHFIGQAEPTDDITLMTICKESPVLPMTINVPCREDQWPVLRNAIHSFGLCIGMERKALKKYEVAAEEAIVNILHYSQANDIEIVLSSQDSAFTIQLMDDGLPFDPTEHTPNNKTIDERQIGGMGIHLIRQIVDEMHYERKEEKNILGLVKKINS
ncbi:MAG: SpoIIE family protein phosphatase [Paludibacteraceae bacterium]|nr:SpoIIE family protein phosphatase [Paludibacteraceae bacterium]MBQ8940117.1 SpoIIE family protein phosphatase [Paludibacteraceae bacterium]